MLKPTDAPAKISCAHAPTAKAPRPPVATESTAPAIAAPTAIAILAIDVQSFFFSQTSVLLFSLSKSLRCRKTIAGACGLTRGRSCPKSQFQNVSGGATYSDHRVQCHTRAVSPSEKTVNRWQQAQRYAMR